MVLCENTERDKIPRTHASLIQPRLNIAATISCGPPDATRAQVVSVPSPSSALHVTVQSEQQKRVNLTPAKQKRALCLEFFLRLCGPHSSARRAQIGHTGFGISGGYCSDPQTEPGPHVQDLLKAFKPNAKAKDAKAKAKAKAKTAPKQVNRLN
jgi:hypothetical protein